MLNLRRYFAKIVADVGATNLLLLILLAIITFYPLFFVGFTTNDDAGIAMKYGSTNLGLLEISRLHAEIQGRFTFLWGYSFLQMPYAVDHRIWYLTMKFGAFFILISALYYSVNKVFRSSWIALVALLFYLSFIQNGWDHNALTSYPFAFNFYATLFLISIGLFTAAIDRNSLTLAGLSAGAYFLALGIELFVLFFPFYFAVLLSRGTPSETVVRQITSSRKFILAIALPLMTYLTIYLVWRSLYPSNYDGNSFSGFNLLAAGKVVAAYSLNAFPFASLNFMISPGHQIPFTNSTGLRGVLSQLNATHFIKPAVAGFLFVRLMTTARFIVPPARTLLIGAIVAGVGIFLPNLLLGFVRKHQDWVASGSYSYLYTYYSFISAAVFVALVAAYMNVKSRSWHPRLRLLLICVGAIAVMVLSFAVEVRNQYISFDQKLSHRKWQLMDVVIKSPAFMEIPDGSTVVAPTLTAHHRGIAVAVADYWSKYTKYKSGKKVQFVDNKCIGGAPCYTLVFRQESHSDNQFVVLAKMKSADSLVSSELTIYSMPSKANTVIVGAFLPNEELSRLEINGTPVLNVGSGLFVSNFPYGSTRGLAQTASVTGNVDMFPDQLTISNYSVVPRLQPFSVDLGGGFYGWETDQNQPTWAWSKGTSHLIVTNYGRKAIPVSIKFEATSLENMTLHISGESAQSFSIAPGVYKPVKSEFMVQPGTTHINLHSDRPPIQPFGDQRLLSFSIRGLRIQNQLAVQP